jgi:hypothetical protein
LHRLMKDLHRYYSYYSSLRFNGYIGKGCYD